jgi:signal-transduction protein with cAMP-binding, CBS, and nucleotidyltransferase domain
MQVKDGMSAITLTVGPGHSLREAARLMAKRGVGAAIVIDPEQPGPGIVTERDLLESLGAGEDPDQEQVCDHLSPHLTFAAPDWSLEEAAVTMVRGGFRHLVVVEGSELAGVLSMRDIVRCWSSDGATSEMPAALDSAAS